MIQAENSDFNSPADSSLGNKQQQLEAALTAQAQVLEALAKDVSLAEMLDLFARTIERQSSEMLCSILLLEGDKLRHGAAPSLPDEYNRAVDGVEIGPNVGSCGTAAYTQQQVIVSDIATDPHWAQFRDFTLGHGLRACWSTPIISLGKVLGTFALYYRTPRLPSEQDQQLIAFWAKLVALGISRKRAEEALRAERLHLIHLLRTQEYERKLVAYEIHDGLVQYATGATMHLDRYLSNLEHEPLAPQLDLVMALLQKTIQEGRRLVNGLRPPILDELGVVAAIDHLIQERTTADSTITFEHETEFARLAPELESAIFRIVQEALTNAQKHSHSQQAKIVLGHTGNRIHVDIQDWGVGFDPARVSEERHGLRGIRQRANLLGGNVAINSQPGKGTKVAVDLPILTRRNRG
ncbi:MAG: GAF domain-containing sensor histidine kinase [Planctomycetes bacterium]|nr:GAF domain-containing sensor histidine kinase [Planctomycetota bacterium]